MEVGISDLTSSDFGFLELAVHMGRLGWGRVHPNPMVGCVLVKEGQIVAQAYHLEFGEGHAEALALELAGPRAQGATAYVSLEPCNHWGKTPPCAEALHSAGITRVVFAAPDPGEEEGGGGKWLRGQGVSVQGPVFGPERWRAENPIFFHDNTERPFVALKLAAGLDGGIAAAPGHQTAISGKESHQEVHRLRAGFDGIMVGTGTWKVDDPRLTSRGEVSPPVPAVRVFLDPRGEFPEDAAAFEGVDDGTGGEVILAVGTPYVPAVTERLKDRARILAIPEGEEGLDLRELLSQLARAGLRSLLCEGGGRLAASLLREELVDRLYWFLSPTVLGSGAVPALPGLAGKDLGQWRLVGKPQGFGPDVLAIYDRVI